MTSEIGKDSAARGTTGYIAEAGRIRRDANLLCCCAQPGLDGKLIKRQPGELVGSGGSVPYLQAGARGPTIGSMPIGRHCTVSERNSSHSDHAGSLKFPLEPRRVLCIPAELRDVGAKLTFLARSEPAS